MSDARFEDGVEQPLRLSAADSADLEVVSALLQDAVAQVSDVKFSRRSREFALLVNRFRWEDLEAAKKQNRPYERVQSVLILRDVLAVRVRALDPKQDDLVFSVLGISFHSDEDGGGKVTFAVSGDAEIELSVESLNLTLSDMSKPYLARSDKAPSHPD